MMTIVEIFNKYKSYFEIFRLKGHGASNIGVRMGNPFGHQVEGFGGVEKRGSRANLLARFHLLRKTG
jgi:hypothetical protein